jgi:mandelamide amidase
VERIIEDALSKLKEAGVILVDMDLPDVMHLLETIIASVRAFEAPRSIAAYLATHGAPISFTWLMDATSPAIARRLKDFAFPSSANSVEAYKHAQSTLRPALRDIYHCYFRQHQLSAVVFPTVRVPAPPITSDVVSPAPDVDLNGRRVPAGLVFGRNVSPASAAGLPGLSIPAGLNSEGLPVGLELDCLSGDDAELLQLGVLVEQVLGRLPPPNSSGVDPSRGSTLV